MRILRSVLSVAALLVAGPALALTLGVGGTSVSVGSGGASVSSGGTSVGASVGGSGGNGGSIASVGGGTGGTSGTANVTGNGGSLIGVQQTDGSTTATVNLGSALNGFLSNPDLRSQLDTVNLNDTLSQIGPASGTPEQVRRAFLSLSFGNRLRVRRTCIQVFSNPSAFDHETRILCSLVGRL